MRSQRGQAAPEYLATLGIVGTLLLTGAAVAEPDVAGEVVKSVRRALCTVSGDICAASDAKAAGLDPCVMVDDTLHRFGGGTILSFSWQGHDTWTGQLRSDGSVVFTGLEGDDVGAEFAAGVSLAPGVRLEASTQPKLGWRGGKTWVFPSLPAARSFIATAQRLELDHESGELPPPTYEFIEGGGSVEAKAGASLLPLATGSLDGALGRRKGADGTTWYLHGAAAARLLGARNGVVEYSVGRDGRPRSLVVRTSKPGPGRGRVTEESGHLDLGDPRNRAVATAVLALRDPRDAGDALAALRARWDAAAVVARQTYGESRESHGVDLGVALGLKIGVNAEHEYLVRELEQASVRFPGDARDRRRVDCDPEAVDDADRSAVHSEMPE